MNVAKEKRDRGKKDRLQDQTKRDWAEQSDAMQGFSGPNRVGTLNVGHQLLGPNSRAPNRPYVPVTLGRYNNLHVTNQQPLWLARPTVQQPLPILSGTWWTLGFWGPETTPPLSYSISSIR